MIKKIYIFIFFSWIVCFSSFSQENNLKLSTDKKLFSVEEKINLVFSKENDIDANLLISSSYGSIIVNRISSKSELKFTLPDFIKKKSGIVFWKIISKEANLSGQIQILPSKETSRLETYVGPPSIVAGGIDFTMLVSIPTDKFDNPLGNDKEIIIQDNFLTKLTFSKHNTSNFITYKRIFSPKKSGRILLSNKRENIDSKEFTVDVYPAIPVNFTINFKRNHEFADGNQITTLLTSVIKDEFNNVVADGTFVNFLVEDETGNILQSNAVTINGVASAKMIHPTKKQIWKVKAVVAGIAESNSIKIVYKNVITDFKVQFLNKNRTIKIGVLKSFMNQKIPDGFPVKMLIYQNDKLIKIKQKTSKEGIVFFELEKVNFDTGSYTIQIKTAGLAKNFKNIKL